MCKLIVIYVLTIMTEINSGHVVYSEEFVNQNECEAKAKQYTNKKYILEANCNAKTIIGETSNDTSKQIP